MKQYNFQNNYGVIEDYYSINYSIIMHRGRFVVVHLCSNFPIDPQNFSRGANFYQKLPFFGDFWGRKATF